MNETTLFLSQLIGPVLIVMGLSMLIRKDAWQEFLQSISHNRALLLYNGMVEGSAGLALLLYHNFWNTPAEIIITLLGWAMFLEGICDLFVSRTTVKDLLHSSNTILNVTGIVSIAVGGYLAYISYLI